MRILPKAKFSFRNPNRQSLVTKFMQIHEIQREHGNQNRKRVGRGGKRGTYSGKGSKGQRAHASSAPRPELRDVIKKLPKLRGYRFNSIQVDFYVVNVGLLDKVFKDGDTISPKTLISNKVLRTKKGERARIKVLGNGELSKKLTILDCVVSKSAREKIEKAGGKIILPTVKEVEKKK